MQIKIMMLLSDEKSKKLCQCAETILNEVAGAFEHRFLILYEKAGEFSKSAYGVPLTEETVEACEKCQGILAGNTTWEGMDELIQALEIPFTARYCGVPQALCGRHERGFSQWMSHVHSLAEEDLPIAIRKSFEIALQNDLPISFVEPNGAAKDRWNTEIFAQKSNHPECAVQSLSAADAVTRLIESPSTVGLLIAPPYAGQIYMAASVALNPAQLLMHDISLSDTVGVYGPVMPQNDTEDVNPIPMVLALADLLRYSAGLKNEADCVNAAVQNVLEAGWRTADLLQNSDMTIDSRDMVDLICEQISLAGQLMYRPEGGIQ